MSINAPKKSEIEDDGNTNGFEEYEDYDEIA